MGVNVNVSDVVLARGSRLLQRLLAFSSRVRWRAKQRHHPLATRLARPRSGAAGTRLGFLSLRTAFRNR